MKYSVVIATAGALLLGSQAYAFTNNQTNVATDQNVVQGNQTVQQVVHNNVFTTQTDQLSYTIGSDMGFNFKNQGVKINPDVLAQGVKDAFTGAQLKMSKQQMETTLHKFQKELLVKREKQFKVQSEVNTKASNDFFASNKNKAGVVTLPSGLQYKVIKQGNGVAPSNTDTVKVNYTGTLLNGKVFDSSERLGHPVTFKVEEVIPGWQQALKLMKPGAVWELYVPPKLAYGSRGLGGPIGPNQALIFKVNLVSVQKDNNS